MENFKQVLFVAPNFKMRKGGIASVMSLYKDEIKNDFYFCPSIYFQSLLLSTLFFPLNILQLTLYLLFKRNIKIVHIHGSHEGSFYRKFIIFFIAKKIFLKKVIFHVHASHFHEFYNKSPKTVKKLVSYLINNVNLLIVLSEEWKLFFKENFTPKKIEVLENVVPYRKPSKNKKLNTKDKINILFLGRIGERKGVFNLLNTLQNNLGDYKPKVTLHIGGDGEISKLKTIIKDKSLDFVTFHGWISGLKKNKLLDLCDIFILPSYNEGLPISLLEAMSFEKPIISTPVGGIPRILKTNYNGILVTPGDEEEMWTAIKMYLDNPLLLQEHGKNSYILVQNHFPDKVLLKLNNIYSNLK